MLEERSTKAPAEYLVWHSLGYSMQDEHQAKKENYLRSYNNGMELLPRINWVGLFRAAKTASNQNCPSRFTGIR